MVCENAVVVLVGVVLCAVCGGGVRFVRTKRQMAASLCEPQINDAHTSHSTAGFPNRNEQPAHNHMPCHAIRMMH